MGSNVTMEIPVIANPPPTFRWYRLIDRDKVELGSGTSTNTDVSAVGKYKLNVQPDHIGTYHYHVNVSNGKSGPDIVMKLVMSVAGMNT